MELVLACCRWVSGGCVVGLLGDREAQEAHFTGFSNGFLSILIQGLLENRPKCASCATSTPKRGEKLTSFLLWALAWRAASRGLFRNLSFPWQRVVR